MKKLMFVAAVAAAMTGLADVTSANIVGYAGKGLDLQWGAVFTSAQFINVGCTAGNEKISLKSLVPVVDESAYEDPYFTLDNMILIQLLDNYGYSDTSREYMWINGEWTYLNEPLTSDITFDAGQGLWISNFTGIDVQFRSSGEVQQSDIDYPLDLAWGAVAVVNAYPTPVLVKDITPIADPSCYEDPYFTLENMIMIQLLDNYGYSDTSRDYLWVNGGWENNGAPVSGTASFPAGEGLWVSNYTGLPVLLHIPAPEL